MKENIYIAGYFNGNNSYRVIRDAGPEGDVVGCAFIEVKGDDKTPFELIASHLSSGVRWFRHDMGLTSDWKHETYSQLFPDGYILIELGVFTDKEHMIERLKTLKEQIGEGDGKQ